MLILPIKKREIFLELVWRKRKGERETENLPVNPSTKVLRERERGEKPYSFIVISTYN